MGLKFIPKRYDDGVYHFVYKDDVKVAMISKSRNHYIIYDSEHNLIRGKTIRTKFIYLKDAREWCKNNL